MPKSDDFEAARAVIAALEGFEAADQERIIRWAREKLNLSVTPPTPPQDTLRHDLPKAPPATSLHTGIKNLSSFITDKNPKNDVQFAAAVAYFYNFEAPSDKRKVEINATDLQDATRLAPRKRFKNPGQTLRNARNLGLLDNGSQEGFFTINSVGENLVAMTLPSGASGKENPRKPTKPRRAKAKKSATKK